MPVIDERALQEEWDAVSVQRIEGLDETATEWRLGRVSLHKTQPMFRWGYGAGLAKTARFRKQPFTIPDTPVRAFAAVFHQFDDADDAAQSPECLAGWVPADKEADLDGWIDFMNREIARRLGR